MGVWGSESWWYVGEGMISWVVIDPLPTATLTNCYKWPLCQGKPSQLVTAEAKYSIVCKVFEIDSVDIVGKIEL
jgi:hypothetical protein